jgi:hypothetical protein
LGRCDEVAILLLSIKLRGFMSKLKIILTAGIAAVLTLSCSNADETGDGSSNSDGGGSKSSSSKGDSSNSNNGGGNNSSSSDVRNESSSSDGSGNESSSNNVGNESSSSRGGNNSSSSYGGNDSGGSKDVKVYDLVNKTADQFTYMEAYEDEYCYEGGVLKNEKDSSSKTINYSINNKIMTWEYKWSHDTLNFKGTSNELIGTWTRTKNKAASCKLYTDDYYGDSWYECKEGYNITKAVFTETNVEITRDICYTDEMEDGREEENGWKQRVVDCNIVELYKGTDKIMGEITKDKETISYKGESCTIEFDPPKSQKEAACREAWNRYQEEYYWEDYYYDILYKDFNDCLKRILPAELMKDDDDYGKVAAKPLAKAKAKITPLLKKRN